MKALAAGLIAVLDGGDRRFRAAGSRAFRFLTEEYGFSGPDFQADFFAATLTYRRRDLAVLVELDKRDRLASVHVVRLRDGKIPLMVNEPQDWILLSALLATRAPEVVPAIARRTGRSLSEIERILQTSAMGLREHAGDVLEGDTRAFTEVAARFPQPRRPLRVWSFQRGQRS